MDDLLKKLQSVHGLSEDQAKAILNTVSEHIKSNMPTLKDKLGNLFSSETLNSLKEKATALGEKLSSNAQSTGSQLGQQAQQVEGKLADEAKDLGGKISEGAKNLFNKFTGK